MVFGCAPGLFSTRRKETTNGTQVCGAGSFYARFRGVEFNLHSRQPPRHAKRGRYTLIWREVPERRYNGTSVFQRLR